MAETAKTEPDASLSPGRSALAVIAGFAVLWILRVLFMLMAGTLFASLYPSGEGAIPTSRGLLLSLFAELVNGALAGLVTGRLAGRSPIAHAAILAGLFGFLGMTSMDQATGMPAWFAIGFAVVAPIGTLVGGVVASRVRT